MQKTARLLAPALLSAPALLLGLGACQCQPPPPGGTSSTDDEDAPPASKEGAEPPEAPPEVGLEEPPVRLFSDDEEPAPQPVQVSATSHCGERDCPLSFDFTLPMVEGDALAGAPPPDIHIEPEVEGRWTWETQDSLAFTPQEGAFPWGHQFEVTLNDAVPLAGEAHKLRQWSWSFRVPNFSAGGKVAYWPVIFGEPRFVGLLNGYTNEIGAGPLFLLYDQPVDPEEIGARIKATIDGVDGPGELTLEVTRPPSGAQVSGEALPVDHVLAVKVLGVEDDDVVHLSLPTYPQTGSAEPTEDLAAEERELTLRVRRSFRLTEHRFDYGADPERVPHSTVLRLVFDGPVSPAAVKQHLAIEPAPESVNVSAYTTALVRLRLSPGTRYTATLKPGLVDVLGNELREQPAPIEFRSRDLPPLLRVPRVPLSFDRAGPTVPVEGRNLGQISVEVVPFTDLEEAVGGLSKRRVGRCAEVARAEGGVIPGPLLDVGLNEVGRAGVDLSELEPGLYCVEVAGPGRGTEAGSVVRRGASVVQISDLGVTTKVWDRGLLAWVTKLSTGEPVPGAKLTLLTRGGERVQTAETEADGTALIDLSGIGEGMGTRKRAFLAAEKGADRSVTALESGKLSQAWHFGLPSPPPGGPALAAALFSERGAYRPGEEVQLKALVSRDARERVGADEQAVLVVRDPRGKTLLSRKAKLDSFGGLHAELALKKAATVGPYSASLTYGGRSAGHTFRVEEYRVPTFEVKVASASKRWKRGEDIAVDVKAAYLHGGALGGRKVKYEVSREAEAFTPSTYPGFRFGLQGGSAPTGVIAAGTTALDGQGRKSVTFSADHPSHVGPMRYRVEASVTDIDRQAYAGQLSKVVHPARFYVGVRAPGARVLKTGDKIRVPIVTVLPSGAPLPGIRVRARVEKVEHRTVARQEGDSAQRLSHSNNRELEACEVWTREAPASCTFTLDEAGPHRVSVWARDKDGNDVLAGFDLMVSGDTPSAWPRFDHERIDLVADKDSYQPGETAKLVVKSPFEKARGLLTLERDGVISHRQFKIDGDTPALEVPLTAEHAPGVYASVVLLRGRVHDDKDATGFQTGAPAMRLGVARLKVSPAEQRLSVEVTPAAAATTPAAELRVDLAVKDHQGRPAAGQATIMVVDEAVLGLTAFQTPDPLADLFPERALGVHTAGSRLDLLHSLRERRERVMPPGDGEESFSLSEFPMQLRKLFKSTAFYDPAVEVGADGKASVSFTLPDNVTTYRVMAVVVDERSRAGSADEKVVVRKPLIVKAAHPRFFYPEDELTVEAIVFNGTDQPGVVAVAPEFEGLELLGEPDTHSVSAEAGAEGKLAYRVKVTGREEATIRLRSKLGEHTDAVERKIPILNPGSRRALVATKVLSGPGEVSLALPNDRQAGTLEAEVVVSSTSLSELKDAVGYLMRYPNGCIEQTTSTAYPLVVLKDLLPEIGVEVSEEEHKKFSTAGVNRILSFQTSKGGLAYWPGSDEPHAFATAFGLTALIEAKERGYDVSDESLRRMGDYLIEALRRQDVTESIPHGNIADGDTRALFVMTLGRLGRPQHAEVSNLWQKKDKLTAFGLSFLATAIREGTGDQALLHPVLAEVRQRAKEEEKEAWFEGERSGGYSMGSPLRRHAASLLAYASASPGHEMNGKLLSGLLTRRSHDGMWGNTQENVFGIMSVVALAKSNRAEATPGTITLNERELSQRDLDAVSGRVKRARFVEEELGRVGSLKAGLVPASATPTYLTVRATWEAELNEKNRRARSNGFSIERIVEDLDGDELKGEIPLGALVRVRLLVKAEEAYNYVAIDDKLPAGLEPMNQELATTEKVSLGPATQARTRAAGQLSYQEMRDHRVAFYLDEMPAGEYELVYIARATTPGRFLRPAAHVEAMYAPEKSGDTAIDEVVVK